MAGIDMNRTTDGVILPREVSSEIWADTQESSAVMRFARPITLPAGGITIPMITGDPDAAWVNETDEIPVGDSELSSRSITGYKLGVIETFSKEFKRDLPGLYEELKRRLPNALARKFDGTVFHSTTAPGADFDTFGTGIASSPLGVLDTYDDIVAIDQAVSDANGAVTGYVLAPRARGVMLRAKDADNRPLLVNDIQRQGGVTQLLGVDVALSTAVYQAGAPETLGFAGDWSQAMYGVVEDISISVSDQATVVKNGQPVNLWQRDMFALKATVHLGFAVRDKRHFVRIVADGDEG